MLAVCDLGPIFSNTESWETSAKDFAQQRRMDGFRAVDSGYTQVSALGPGKCSWFGLPLMESRVYFTENGVSRVELSLYNRGDAAQHSSGSMSEAALNELLDKVHDALEAGEKVPRTTSKKNRSGGVQCERVYDELDPSAELDWGLAANKSVDFVRLTLKPFEKKRPKGITKSVSGKAAAAKVKVNVTKNDKGDVWIENVPMVDQGQKGYCAAAVSERVLRYYGHNIDEHEIAQMAGSTAGGGTQVSEMIETVKVVGQKCRLAFTKLVSMTGEMKDIKKEIEMYNKSARRLKKRTIAYNQFLQGNTFMVPRMREAMETDVLLDMRTRDARFKKFLADVKKTVDQGIPVFWGVTLGIFPEPGVPQSGGGHMRLIIGYNKKTKEILFTDTWGRGHELKRMPEDKAFTITHDAFYLRPL